jgi:hypothetical protein
LFAFVICLESYSGLKMYFTAGNGIVWFVYQGNRIFGPEALRLCVLLTWFKVSRVPLSRFSVFFHSKFKKLGNFADLVTLSDITLLDENIIQ